MKLRTSFFEPTVFRKNITRFAPVWGLYCVFLVLTLLVMLTDSSPLAVTLTHTDQYAGIINLVYALACVLMLFGDLYSPRMCNALHALPLRRESLFFTNVLSGLSFSLFPTLLFSLLTLPLCASGKVIGGMWASVYFFVSMNLSFLFFFALAVLCAFLVGNRFALTLVYSIFNFLSMLIYWLVDTLYIPLLTGIRSDSKIFELFCPVVQLSALELVDYSWEYTEHAQTGLLDAQIWTVSAGTGWGYLLVCAAIGLGLLGLGLLLYRRRKLECAGDFLSLKLCGPVFLVIYSLVTGAVLQLGKQLFIGGSEVDAFLYIGLVVGFFTGLMLLNRTVRVFRLKALLGCAGLVAVMLVSLGITRADPMGLTKWIPQPEEISSVTVYYGHNRYRAPGNAITLEDPADIAAVLELHGYALTEDAAVTETRDEVILLPYNTKVPVDEMNGASFILEYTLTGGATRSRYYSVYVKGGGGAILESFLTRTECVLGVPEEELQTLADQIDYVEAYHQFRQREDILSLLQAIAADCDAGVMAQGWAFQALTENRTNLQTVEFSIPLENGVNYWHYIQVYGDCANTLAWMEAHDVPINEE